MKTRIRTRLSPSLALAALALLAATSCKSTGPTYGGMMVDVTIRIEAPQAREEAATEAAATVEGWVIDTAAWKSIDGRSELPRLAALQRDGMAEEAAQLRSTLVTALDRERLAAIRRAETVARLPATTLYLIARSGGVLAWKEFDSTIERKVALEP